MPVETRVFDHHTQTINGLTAYKLQVGWDDIYCTDEEHTSMGTLWQVGIRVWKRSSAGVETEITSGVPVAVVELPPPNIGMFSNTWACPLTSLDATDSIVVRVYQRYYISSWSAWSYGWGGVNLIFTTETLNTSQLNASTWTVYYMLNYAVGEGLYITYGKADCPMRIENFSYGAVAPSVSKPVMDGFVYVS